MMNWKKLMSSARFGDSKEDKKANPLRSDFEIDYDRIIFSAPFRNLQDKTQVFPLPDQDFVHTRLTHSLEVSSVGKSLGKNVGAAVIEKYPELSHLTPYDFGAVVGAAALAHDVGNPPFGHSGEQAISDYFLHNEKAQKIKTKVSSEEWHDLIRFEGNAQGFRLLTKNQKQGIRLTFATLAAFSKYPCSSSLTTRDNDRKSQKKHGYFRAEESAFVEVASQLGLTKLSTSEEAYARHPLAFLVEAADDICYSIIDLEDGFGLGLVTFEETRDFLAEILGDNYYPEKLDNIASDKEKIGVLRAVAINTLIYQTSQAYMKHEGEILNGEFDKALTDLIPTTPTLKKLSDFSIKRIYQSRQVLEKEAAGYEIIDGLLEAFIEAVFCKFYNKNKYSGRHKSVYRLLPSEVQFKLDWASSPYESVLEITDYISGMTDSSAVKQFRIMKGISLA
ncbi:deoxyguanosinetriphosphate triphosphohydrolase [Reichenbachiella carrageenanivorans]|uniref:Deoxyguanosinetriphosphate triphosphohydrolase n=1 Tax=Reichenbachiella carrageenanivorans TaxID=2979869 RepID=A0ABY6D436_9BACT|nr:deoxyguanosinetriphosphate triphosphohydrolase [Reichenbachiella carrageenanivorans]UXX80924.1 deoxyguanosinetriphosphate triphosphohydrolase [Reichenbachiella carrageenanivorans]